MDRNKKNKMISSRRQFLTGISFAGLVPRLAAIHTAASRHAIRAVAFDAFPILDPRPVFALADELYPGRGRELSSVWRTRQFEYMWLRTLSHHYADFWQVTGDALVYAAKAINLEISPGSHARLMDAYLKLQCWPEVPAALRALKEAGIRIAFLSNMTPQLLEAGIRNSKLDGVFDHVLSTDRVKAYKPDPRAYQMGVDAFGLKRQQILFAAFAGWDAAGARSFGYPTVWVNRQNQPGEELGVPLNATCANVDGIVALLTTRGTSVARRGG
jgi:2-haloacid dehalogenase